MRKFLKRGGEGQALQYDHAGPQLRGSAKGCRGAGWRSEDYDRMCAYGAPNN